jgi:type I restriction enzyme, R subunit
LTPAGVVEAKKEGETLTGYEIQTEKYSVGLPDELKPYRRPLPFCYQSTGIETRFTNLLEPDARSRRVFSFHRPETFADWLMEEAKSPGSTLRAKMRRLPPVVEKGLWPAQVRAIKGLERSLAEGRPRALIQMASGGGFMTTMTLIGLSLSCSAFCRIRRRCAPFRRSAENR